MLRGKRKKILTGLLLVAAFSPGIGLKTGPTPSRSAAAEKSEKGLPAKPAPGLSLAEFKELKPILDVKNRPWATIPWKYSITEARKQAAATRKPIFMVV